MKFSLLFRPEFFFILLLSLCANMAMALHPYLNLEYRERSFTYGSREFQVLDLSEFHKEAMAKHYPGIKTVNAGQIFKPGTVFLGFGLPNVFTARITADGHVRKFDVKSLHRAESTIVESEKGIAQSGYFIVLKNISPQVMNRVIEQAEKLKGHTYQSCAEGNYELLKASGFSIQSSNPSESYFLPTSLFRSILTHGILYDGQVVEYDIVKTTPLNLYDFMTELRRAIRNTPIRHLKKNNVSAEYIEQASLQAEQVARENEELLRNNPASAVAGNLYSMRTSIPSKAGSWARSVWGAHTIYEIALGGENQPQIKQYLPDVLKEFPIPAKDCKTRLKRKMFTQKTVAWIRSKMAHSFSDPKLVDEEHILDLLHPHSDQNPHIFNFVVTSKYLYIGRISVQWGWVDWGLSKHVVLSNFAPDVHFAGELKLIDGVVNVNRLSGSYLPSEEALASIVEFAQTFFPNLPIVAEGNVYIPKVLREEEEKRPPVYDYPWVEVEQTETKPFINDEKE